MYRPHSISLRMLIILDLYLLFSLDEAYKSMESDERGHSILVQVRLKNESSDRRSEDVVMAESMKTSEATSGLTKELALFEELGHSILWNIRFRNL